MQGPNMIRPPPCFTVDKVLFDLLNCLCVFLLDNSNQSNFLLLIGNAPSKSNYIKLKQTFTCFMFAESFIFLIQVLRKTCSNFLKFCHTFLLGKQSLSKQSWWGMSLFSKVLLRTTDKLNKEVCSHPYRLL